MRTNLLRMLSVLCLLGIAGTASANYPRVSFSHTEREISENAGSTTVNVQLSQASSQQVVVPFYIDPAQSNLVHATAKDAQDGHFFIESNPSTGLAWDRETLSGTLTFDPGRTQWSVPVTVIDNDTVDTVIDPETQLPLPRKIVFQMDEANVTVARPVHPLQTTLHVLDNDPITVFFETRAYSVVEGNAATISLMLSSTKDHPIEVSFSLPVITDTTPAEVIEDLRAFDTESSTWPTNNTVIIPRNQQSFSFSLPTIYRPEVHTQSKPVELRLTGARLQLTEEQKEANPVPAPIPLAVHDHVATIEVIDRGAVEVSLDMPETEGPSSRTIPEFGTASVAVRVSTPQPHPIIIPVTLTGTATRGDGGADADNADYTSNLSDANTITIPARTSTANIQFTITNDLREEGDESIVIKLGTPRLGDGPEGAPGTELPLSERSRDHALTLVIEDNDPVKLSFGNFNPDYDAGDEDAPRVLPASGFTAARSDGYVSIPVILSAAHALQTQFRLEVVSEGTTAKMLSSGEEDWDFYIDGVQGTVPGQPVNVAIRAMEGETVLGIVINNPINNRTTYPWTRDPQTDRTVRLRLTEVVNTSTSGVSLGEHSEFVLTIREFPDIEVTHLFQDPVKTEQPQVNNRTGLFDVPLGFQLRETAPSPEGLEGYRSYKIVFRPGIYDGGNRSNPDNDPTTQSARGTIYDLVVTPPLRPRYPSRVAYETLAKGTPRSGAGFNDANADVLIAEYAYFQPLALPVFDPSPVFDPPQNATSSGAGLNAPFNFLIEFTRGGKSTFDLNRLVREGAVRVFLSRHVPSQPGARTVVLTPNVLNFVPQADGSVFVEVDNPNRRPISVQYLDEDLGEWRDAQPPLLQQLGTRLQWIDHGPPRTERHPSEVPFRLYRFHTAN